ncbi:unnamed protein product [Prunus armeniaca]
MNRQTFEGNRGRGNWPTTCADKSGRHKYMQTFEGNWRKRKLANHLGRKIRQVAWEILIGHQYTTHMYCKHFKATGKGNLSNHLCRQSEQVDRQSQSDSFTLNTTTCKQRKVTRERGNSPTTYPNISGRQLGTRKLANHLGSKIGQVAKEIMVGQLTVYKA